MRIRVDRQARRQLVDGVLDPVALVCERSTSRRLGSGVARLRRSTMWVSWRPRDRPHRGREPAGDRIEARGSRPELSWGRAADSRTQSVAAHVGRYA